VSAFVGGSQDVNKEKTLPEKLRQPHKQAEYREKSRSTQKESQHVAHIASLELVSHIQGTTPGPVAVDALRDVVNDFSNLRMVSTATNLGQHKSIDKALIEKSETGATLTQAELQRALQQVAVYQSNADQLPPGHNEAAKNFFKSLNSHDGSTLWDARKD
jgi:hypothetical protein